MNESKSIEELENDSWQDIEFPTPLVEKCYRYRKVPINDLSVEQVRLLLGQKIGLRFLVPKAIQFLRKDILSEGDFFPGDLLIQILRLDTHDWKDNRELHTEFNRLLTQNESAIIANDIPEILKEVQDYKKYRLHTT
jgi:hypothetical protein